jgi:hypothetical protein
MNQMEGEVEAIAKVASTAVVVSVSELGSMTGKTYVLGDLDWTAQRPFREGDVAVVVQSSFPVGTGVDARLELWSDDSWRVRLRVFNALGRALPAGRHAATIEVYAEAPSVVADITAHLAGIAAPEELPCVSGYVGDNGECNDCGKHHAASIRAQAVGQGLSGEEMAAYRHMQCDIERALEKGAG